MTRRRLTSVWKPTRRHDKSVEMNDVVMGCFLNDMCRHWDALSEPVVKYSVHARHDSNVECLPLNDMVKSLRDLMSCCANGHNAPSVPRRAGLRAWHTKEESFPNSLCSPPSRDISFPGVIPTPSKESVIH
eukprot:5881256-Amphidinium_carterae.1